MNALLGCEKNTESLKEFKAELLLSERNYSVLIQHSSDADSTATYFHWPTLLHSVCVLFNHSFKKSCILKSLISQVCFVVVFQILSSLHLT